MRGYCSNFKVLALFGVLQIMVLSTSALAQSETIRPQQVFTEANYLLVDGEFSGALDLYRIIETSGEVSGPLYLNMGIAATRLDSLGLAKYYFILASEFPEVSLAAEEGLSFVEDVLGRRGARIPQLMWTKVSTILFIDINYTAWILAGILLFNIGGVLFALHWIRKKHRKINQIAGISMLSVGIVVIIMSLILELRSARYELGIQITREVQVRTAPSDSAEIVQTGFEGFQYIIDKSKAVVYREDGRIGTDVGSSGSIDMTGVYENERSLTAKTNDETDWVFVRMSNGARGWVRDSALLRIGKS